MSPTNRHESPIDQLETIVIDPAEVIAGIRTNRQYQHRNDGLALLRLSPPFNSQVGAEMVVVDHDVQPTEQSSVYIPPAAFVEGTVEPPDESTVQEIAKQFDGVGDLDDVSQQTLDACWDIRHKAWAERVREHLVEEITLRKYTDGRTCVVPVEYTPSS